MSREIYCISHHRSLVHFSSRRSAEGKRKFSQVNDPVACFWFIFGSRPEVLELARSSNPYFLECYVWVVVYPRTLPRRLSGPLEVKLSPGIPEEFGCVWFFSVPRLLNTNWTNSFRFGGAFG